MAKLQLMVASERNVTILASSDVSHVQLLHFTGPFAESRASKVLDQLNAVLAAAPTTVQTSETTQP